jgi:hypothetical protein
MNLLPHLANKVSSQMIYLDQIPQWIVSVETFGIGDGNLLKLTVSDIKLRDIEELVVTKREDSMYTILTDVNSSMLMSEERMHIFRATYGTENSLIDFSTYKFRRVPDTKKGKQLI